MCVSMFANKHTRKHMYTYKYYIYRERERDRERKGFMSWLQPRYSPPTPPPLHLVFVVPYVRRLLGPMCRWARAYLGQRCNEGWEEHLWPRSRVWGGYTMAARNCRHRKGGYTLAKRT